MPFVYLLRCGDGSLYAGAAVDLDRRLAEHRAGRASRYTRSRLPVELVWRRELATWSEALRAEARLKRLRRAEKLALAAGFRRNEVAAPAQGRRSDQRPRPERASGARGNENGPPRERRGPCSRRR